MKRIDVKVCVILLILIGILNLVAFVVPFNRDEATFWIGYIFATIAILFQVYVYFTTLGSARSARSKFYGFPILKVGIAYSVIQLILGLVEMATAEDFADWVAILINVILLAFAVIGCIAADAMRDAIEKQDNQLKKDVSTMRELQSLAASLAGLCKDDESKAVVQKIAEELRYSDPVSSERSKEIEMQIMGMVHNLRKSLMAEDFQSAKDIASAISVTLAERNRVCAMDKK